jgi:hypothetical protein
MKFCHTHIYMSGSGTKLWQPHPQTSLIAVTYISTYQHDDKYKLYTCTFFMIVLCKRTLRGSVILDNAVWYVCRLLAHSESIRTLLPCMYAHRTPLTINVTHTHRVKILFESFSILRAF